MLKLVAYANRLVKEIIARDNVQSVYLNTCEEYGRNHRHTFAIDMQTLITKVGKIVAEVTNKKMSILPMSL